MRCFGCAALILICTSVALAQGPRMGVEAYRRLPDPTPDHVLHYGESRSQFGHLRLPMGSEPAPVVIVIHGGCWTSEFGLEGTSALSAELTKLGFATWNVEYRRIGQRGGRWPGTFEDVAAAADYLRVIAGSHPLDLDNVIAVGHSAGGQMALWLAARKRQPPESPGARNPIPIHGVVALAAVTDLVIGERANVCGSSIRNLMRGSAKRFPERYALSSPASLLPLRVPQVLVHGAMDGIVPPIYSSAYVTLARRFGDSANYVEIVDAGHFNVVAPQSTAWTEIVRAITELTAATDAR